MDSKKCKPSLNLGFITPPAPRATTNCSHQALLGRTIAIPNTFVDILTFNPTLDVPTLVNVQGSVTFHLIQTPTPFESETQGLVGLIIEVDGQAVSHGKQLYVNITTGPDLVTITLAWCGVLSPGRHTIKLRGIHYNPLETDTIVVDPLSTVAATAASPDRGDAFLTVLLFDL